MAHNYGVPREGLFYHFEYGTHLCPSCDSARVTYENPMWRVQYFKAGQPLDSGRYDDEEMRQDWDEGKFRPMYSPIVNLPDGA